jgi:RNA polymerase sigma factor (sigma-70 family)
MREEWALTQDSFEMLLAWLAPEREMAGQKYETIRRRLIKIFYGRGLPDAEVLADETINRVARKVNEIVEHYEGDPALYFYGIAQKVYLEACRKKPEITTKSEPIYQPVFDEHSDEYLSRRNCLNKCLVKLPDEERGIVVQYYGSEEQTNINHRHQLAKQFGLTPNSLRVRAFRIRQRLQKCVLDCLQKIETK